MKKLLFVSILLSALIGTILFADWDNWFQRQQDKAALEQYRRDQARRHRETMQQKESLFYEQQEQQRRLQQSVPRYRSRTQAPTYLPVPMFDPQLAAVIQQLQAQNANQFNRIMALERSIQVLRKEIHQLRVASYAQTRRKIRPTKRQNPIDFSDLIPPKGFELDEPNAPQDPNSNFDFQRAKRK